MTKTRSKRGELIVSALTFLAANEQATPAELAKAVNLADASQLAGRLGVPVQRGWVTVVRNTCVHCGRKNAATTYAITEKGEAALEAFS